MARGYQSYRGRRPKGRGLLIVLLVVILVAACVYMYAQRYVVYRDDGSWYFDLPFLQGSGRDESGSGEENPAAGNDQDGQENDESTPGINLVVDDAQPEGDAPDEPDEPVAPEVPYGERRLIALSALPADAAALEASLAQAGANGFVYTVRDDTGKVFYSSAVSQEQAAQRDITMESLSALCAGEDTVAVARFNCFHDSYYAYVNTEGAAICQSGGGVWSDERVYYWLDPAKEAARKYVIDLALECAQMGFDELLLDELAYPGKGALERIDYSGNTMGKTEALALFLDDLRQALNGTGVKLSLLVTESLLQNGADETTGQDLAALLPLVDAVYVETADPAAAQALLAQYTGEAKPPVLVPITAQAAEGNWCLTAG